MGGRGRWISEFEVSLVCRVSSRTARTTQGNPVSKKGGEEEKEEKLKLLGDSQPSSAEMPNPKKTNGNTRW